MIPFEYAYNTFEVTISADEILQSPTEVVTIAEVLCQSKNCVSLDETYAYGFIQLNRIMMTFVFFVPLSFIALYESQIQHSQNPYIKDWFRGVNEGENDDPLNRDPEVTGGDAESGLKICKVSFEDLIKKFPNTHESSEASTTRQIKDLKKQIEELTKLVQMSLGQEKGK